MNILVVDDDALIRDMLCRVVGIMGHTAIGACNGKDALDVISGSIDLVISDCDMPVMSGPEMLAALKSDPRVAHVPVIMMSGDFDNCKATESAFAFVSKPFSTDTLIKEINRALAQGSK